MSGDLALAILAGGTLGPIVDCKSVEASLMQDEHLLH